MLKNKDKLSDLDLINKVKKQFSNEAMEELINRHDQLFYSTVHRYHKKHPQSRLNDLLDDMYIVFNQSVNTYNSEKKTKFSTWLSYMTYFHCLNSNKNLGKTHLMEHKDLDMANESQNKWTNFSHNVTEMNDRVFYLLDQMSDKRAQKIFHYRFIVGNKKNNRPMSWSKVAKKLNLSIMGVLNIYRRSLKFLYNKMKDSDNINDTI